MDGTFGALEWVAFLHAACLLHDPKIRSCNEDGKRKRGRWRVTGRFEWGRRAAMEEISTCSSSTADFRING